jgi:mono/diheme cytochrome c family protein
MRPSRWTIALLACMFTLPPHRGVAQATDSAKTTALTTFSGVYTAAQAGLGRNVFLESCRSCHTPVELADSKFWNAWVGRTIADLFSYLREKMPKDNPYSLSDEDYASVTAYILQLNAMPAGERVMPADSAALAKIRITKADTVKQADTIKKRTVP